MRKLLLILLILVTLFLIQLFFYRYSLSIPDLTLLMVIFIGAYFGILEVVAAGLIAGILRGSVSVGTLHADIFSFIFIGITSALLTRYLDRSSFFVHVFITFVGVFLLFNLRLIYLNHVFQNDVDVSSFLSGNTASMLTTIIVSPFLFISLKKLLID